MPDINEKAHHPLPEACVGPTEFMDYEDPAVRGFLDQQSTDFASLPERERAVKLYYLVRDHWRYNPYTVSTAREKSRASFLVKQKQGYCIPKALLLATFARAYGIPARLGFGDVKNHLSSERLIAYLKSDVFAFHGFAELYIDGGWVRATPAFDRRLCRRFNVAPLEFDGAEDSLFQEYDRDGRRFMDYIRYHGVFADLPFDYIFKELARLYPHLFENDALPEGDLYSEAVIDESRTGVSG